MARWAIGWLAAIIVGAILDIFMPAWAQLGILFGVLFAGLLVIVYGTIAKNRWGVNLASVSCPRCHALLPKVRVPQSRKQQLWGGATCAACGTEVDKWGREVAKGTAI